MQKRNRKVLLVLTLAGVILVASGCRQKQTMKDTSAIFSHIVLDTVQGQPCVGDIDMDGLNDIIKKGEAGKEPLVLYRWTSNDTPEKHILSYDLPLRCDRIDLGDIDRDGDLDLVAGIERDSVNYIGWLENPLPDGDPVQLNAWQYHVIAPRDGYIKDIKIADFNHDGKPDIVTREHEITVIQYQDSPFDWPEKEVLKHESHEGMDVADMDNDGDPDIVLNGFWFESPSQPSDGDFIKHIYDSLWFTPVDSSWRDNNSSVKVADILGSKIPEILISHSELPGYPISMYTVNTVDDLKNDNWTEIRIKEQYDFCQTLDAGDIDNDGDMDILAAKFKRQPDQPIWANDPPYPVSVFYNISGDGLAWKEVILSDSSMYAGILGDVGSDGDLDIIGSKSYYTGPLNMWENSVRREP